LVLGLGVGLGRAFRKAPEPAVADDGGSVTALDVVELDGGFYMAGSETMPELEEPLAAVDAGAALSGGQNGPAPSSARDVIRSKSGTQVTLDANEPALVMLGKQELGMTPVTITLKAGKYRFELTEPTGARSAKVDVAVNGKGTLRREVRLK
jgi:hypothetical protein